MNNPAQYPEASWIGVQSQLDLIRDQTEDFTSKYSASDALDVIDELMAIRGRVELVLPIVVRHAREQGATWDEIGAAAGRTAKTMRERYS